MNLLCECLSRSGNLKAQDIGELDYHLNRFYVEVGEEFTIVHWKIWAFIFDRENFLDIIEPR